MFKNRNYKLRVQAWSLGGEGKYSSPEKEFRFGKFFFFDSLQFLNPFFNLDDEGRLLLRKFIFYYMIFPDLISLILVYNPDTSLLYHNIASKHYSFLTILFILLSLYCLCR